MSLMLQKARMRARIKAFTLVEILVVIGIIAVLIGILVPTVNKARESARTAACLSNLRQLTTAAFNYSADHNHFIIPVGNTQKGGSSYWWCNIMVDDKYIPAPSDPGAAPQTRGVFYCPSGNEDPIPEDVSASVPPDRVDDRGASVVRRFSTISNVPIDLWYGINGEDSSGTNNSTTTGTPCRRIQQRPSASDPGTRMTTMDMVKKPSETVMFFDGVLYNHTRVNANRVNARHGRKTQTNIGFFDGHAETFLTKDLPGGLKATTADFALSNLQAKYPRPLWLLEQQY